MIQSKPGPGFKIYSAHELEAQRVVLRGDVQPERSVSEERKVVEGDWVYCVEHDGDLQGLEGSYAMIVAYEGSQSEVEIPGALGGYEVRELFNQVFARNATLAHAVMPDSVRRIGLKTFFQCANLKHVRFSDALEELDAQTLMGCRSLDDVHLPAALRAMPKRLLYDCPVRTVVVPASVERIEDQAFDQKKLAHLVVDERNESFSTDGIALFSADGGELKSLAVQVEDYSVPETCFIVGDSAFKGQTELQSVSLGPNVRVISDFAFFRTALREIELPSSLVEIGQSAFSLCSKLERAVFNEGLERIGSQAFSKTALSQVRIPATVEEIGQKAFERTGIDFESESSFAIDPANPLLSTDGKALYRKGDDGVELVSLLCEQAEYQVRPGTSAIAAGAFEHESKLAAVDLPEGLRAIGARAFKACEKLTSVNLPDSLEVIGEEAFWQTSLSAAHIGPAVREIGPFAFQVAGASRKHDDRTLESIDVDARNPRYYYQENILIERGDKGDRALMFVEPRDYVVIPHAVTEICETAFYHAHVREMRFHGNIKHVDPRAVLGIDEIDRVYVEFPHPVDGFSEVTVEFPYQARDMEDFTRPLCIDDDGLFFDFATYDSMVVHEIDPTAVVRMILARFEQPVKLGEAARAHFESALKGFMNPVLRRYAQEVDTAGYERLAKNGYFDEETRALALRIAESEHADKAVEYLKNM